MTTPAYPHYTNSLEWLYRQTRAGAPRSAERMRALIDQLGLKSPPTVVHVVGTNGKGSVAAMLARAYAAEGVRVGRFLSPHVTDFRERTEVSGVPVSEAEVVRFVEGLPPDLKVLGTPPAFFELALALALGHFARQGTEVAVIEAGVGARQDATRALENVRSVVLTNVGRDHLDMLGPTLADVAFDKADAIRPGVPTLSGWAGDAVGVLAEVASKRRSPLFLDLPNSRLFALPDGTPPELPTRTRNQRLASATLRLAGLSEPAIACGLTATLPARVERFTVCGREVILDGAHNPDAAGALLEAAKAPFVLVFGALAKKLGAETLRVLEPYAQQVVITNVGGETSALACRERAFAEKPEDALAQALRCCPEDGRVVIAGSFYLAGQLRPHLQLLAESQVLP